MVRTDNRILETMSLRRALLTAHPGAILLHQGESYKITRLDLDNQQATARPTPDDAHTEAITTTDLDITATTQTRPLPGGILHLGQVTVADQVIGYRRMRYDKPAGEGVVELPPVTMATVGLWVTPTDQVRAQVRGAGLDWLGGLHAAEHAMIHMLPLFAMCDPHDAGGLSTTRHPATKRATLFIYDGHPGGIGLTAKAFTLFEQLADTTYQLINDCACEEGCPSCVYDRQCGNANTTLDKHAALLILDSLRATNHE